MKIDFKQIILITELTRHHVNRNSTRFKTFETQILLIISCNCSNEEALECYILFIADLCTAQFVCD